MPKSFDESNLSFTTVFFGSLESNVNFSVNGNVITGSTTKKIDAYEGVTIKLTLPDGYFVDAGKFLTTLSVIAIIIVCISTIIALICFVLFNKRSKYKVVETVEFYPPKDLNSAEISLIYNGNCKQKDVLALIFELAGLGYIKIHEVNHKSNNKKSFYLFEKINDYNGHDDALKNIMNALFIDNNTGESYVNRYIFQKSIKITELKKHVCVLTDELTYEFANTATKEKNSINYSATKKYLSPKNKLIKIVLFFLFILTFSASVFPSFIASGIAGFFILLFLIIGIMVGILIKGMPIIFKLVRCSLFAGAPWFIVVKNCALFGPPYQIFSIIGSILAS